MDETLYCGVEHIDSSDTVPPCSGPGLPTGPPARLSLPPDPEGARRALDPVPLDETDRKILAELSRDARQSVTAIAATVHVSRAHAYARINRLRDEGVILRFSTVVDPVRAGLQASACVTLELRQSTRRELCAQLQAVPRCTTSRRWAGTSTSCCSSGPWTPGTCGR